jgi:hypothetical protein
MSDLRTVPAFRREDGRSQIIQSLVQQASHKFDPDILAAMDQRDNALVEDEVVHGAQSRAFVYSIAIAGAKRAEGITVVGARQLASVYGGIQATVISTLSKRGGMFISRSFPYGGFPGRLDVQKIPDLEEEEDFYEVMIEVHDIKTGNKIPSSRREYRFEKRSEQSMKANPQQDPMFERPHLEQIAFSKAFRNGVTALIPQDAVLQFKAKNLALNADQSFVVSLMEEKRSGVLRYAAARAIGIDRDAMERLTFDQIAGLADAAREGSQEGFLQSANALGIVVGGEPQDQRRVVSAPKAPVEGQRQVSNGQQQADPKAKDQPAKRQDQQAATTTTRPAETKPAAAATAERKTTPAKQEKPTFDHHAFDAIGEEVTTPEGFALHFSSAIDFALWYRSAYDASKGNEALVEHNADALADASLDPDAAAILEAIGFPKDDEKESEGQQAEAQPEPENSSRPAVPLTKMPSGGPDWPTYNAALAEDLKAITTEAEMDEWVKLNKETFESKLQPRSRTNFTSRVEPMVDAKYKELRAGPPRDHDMERALSFIEDWKKAQTQADLRVIGTSAAIQAFVARMGKDRPEILKMLIEADADAAARVKALPPQTEQPDEQS